MDPNPVDFMFQIFNNDQIVLDFHAHAFQWVMAVINGIKDFPLVDDAIGDDGHGEIVRVYPVQQYESIVIYIFARQDGEVLISGVEVVGVVAVDACGGVVVVFGH